MPEGPSIIILKEECLPFIGKKVLRVEGNTKIEKERMQNKKILFIKSWGKHFLIGFSGFTLKVHFMLFGSYKINEPKDRPARLSLFFSKGEINFYSCSVKFLEEDLDKLYDWSADVMSDLWDPKKARKKLKDRADVMVCDTLLEQDIFAGVGNIIKNEVLYRVRVHPESLVGKIPSVKITALIKEARQYSFDFLEWKRLYVLRKHWLAHTKKTCLRCNLSFVRKHTGFRKRRSFFCTNCQILYA